MEWLFGKKKTPAQMLRENKRLLERTMRNLDRERTKMEQQEKKIINDVKKMAKEGQMVCIKLNPFLTVLLLQYRNVGYDCERSSTLCLAVWCNCTMYISSFSGFKGTFSLQL